MLFAGCTDRISTAPGGASKFAPWQPNKLVAEVDDPCWDDPDYECHDDAADPTTDDFDIDPADAPDWDSEECPSGCTTYPLGNKTKSAILDELNNFIRPDSDCQAVKNWVVNMVSTGHVRFYPNNDGDWGDYHPPVLGGEGDVHLHTNNFLPGNKHELGMTLMHEGYHGYYGYYGDPTPPSANPAENFAMSCVTN